MDVIVPRTVPILVVLPPRATLLDIAGPLEVLGRANAVQEEVSFVVKFVGASSTIETSVGAVLAEIEPLPPELSDDSIIMIMGQVQRPLKGPMHVHKERDPGEEKAIVDWLKAKVTRRHKLVTICSGALFAARAGLLDGRSCTTHYMDCAELARIAPTANVLTNRLFVQDGEVYTCAGVTSGIDLTLYLLNQMIGRECTLAVARYLVVYLRRSGSDPQISPWLEGRNHIHPAIHRVQDAIAKDPTKAWTRPQLASIAGASGRHLSRLFHEHVGMPIVDYRNRLRVALAHELLSHSQLDIENVAERAGFESTRQLRRAWGRVYTTSPRHARVAR